MADCLCVCANVFCINIYECACAWLNVTFLVFEFSIIGDWYRHERLAFGLCSGCHEENMLWIQQNHAECTNFKTICIKANIYLLLTAKRDVFCNCHQQNTLPMSKTPTKNVDCTLKSHFCYCSLCYFVTSSSFALLVVCFRDWAHFCSATPLVLGLKLSMRAQNTCMYISFFGGEYDEEFFEAGLRKGNKARNNYDTRRILMLCQHTTIINQHISTMYIFATEDKFDASFEMHRLKCWVKVCFTLYTVQWHGYRWMW